MIILHIKILKLWATPTVMPVAACRFSSGTSFEEREINLTNCSTDCKEKEFLMAPQHISVIRRQLDQQQYRALSFPPIHLSH